VWYAWKRIVKCTEFWWENPMERGHLEDQDVDDRMGFRLDLREIGWGVESGFSWLRIEGGGEFL
jgi:hypothetical protein